MFYKPKKFPVNWRLEIPIQCKCNITAREHNRAKQITSSFHAELHRSRVKYWNADLEKKREIILPAWLFEARETFKARLPYSSANKKVNELVCIKVCALAVQIISAKTLEILKVDGMNIIPGKRKFWLHKAFKWSFRLWVWMVCFVTCLKKFFRMYNIRRVLH